MKIRVILWLLIAAAAGGLLAGCGKAEKTAVDIQRVVKIVGQQPREMEFIRKIRVQGNIESKDTVDIASRTSGNLDDLRIDEGSRVEPGDVLFQIDRVNLENNVEQQMQKVKVAEAELLSAGINLQIAQAVFNKAELDLKRAEKLRQSQAVSDDAYERAKLNFDEAKANIRKNEAQENYYRAKVGQEEAALKVARKTLDDSRIVSPIHGVVVSKEKSRDEYVNSGELILRIENLDRLELVCSISSSYFSEIRPGITKAIVYLSRSGKGIELPVSFCSPSVDSLSRTFKVKIDLPAGSQGVSGQLCDLELILQQEKGVGVPSEAVLTRANNRKIVFVEQPDHTARSVEVKTGIVDGAWTQLLDPEVLDKRPVIVEGQAFLADGDKVEDTRTAAAAGKEE